MVLSAENNLLNSNILSVTRLITLFNEVLTAAIPEVVVEGEIFQIKTASSGHIYLTLKDETSQVAGVMWRGIAQRLDFKPKAGDKVLCYCRPNVYHGSGKLQIIIHRMMLYGEGLLRQKFLELKAKLEAQGFFEPSRKRKLPFLPSAIGIVTSKTGAAIHDMMRKIKERMPSVEVYLIDVRVQGENAAKEIAAAIKQFNKKKLVDVLIVGRGGGSLQDLWAFNEEIVVRAIFASKIPIISAVGHEVDVTLSDLAADVRAPTPTAAAEIVVPKREELLEQLKSFESALNDLDRWLLPFEQRLDEVTERLKESLSRNLEESRQMLDLLLKDLFMFRPDLLLKSKEELLNNLKIHLSNSIIQKAADLFQRYYSAEKSLTKVPLKQDIAEAKNKILSFQTSAAQLVKNMFNNNSRHLSALRSNLLSLSPSHILQRGYSIVFKKKEGKKKRKVVRSYLEVKKGEELELALASGSIKTAVKQAEKKSLLE
ncbi:MAG: exodeoxyribonuclease VII large subunit [Candidatus Dadabacteria bacterium]|nr:MAG: exodeoxyribonuclease VII large subunit [Candidatus Dadabacteria bacterium]